MEQQAGAVGRTTTRHESSKVAGIGGWIGRRAAQLGSRFTGDSGLNFLRLAG